MRILLSLLLFAASANAIVITLGVPATGGSCTPGSKSDFVAGSQSWTVPTGCTTIQIDLRGPGGGGGGGAFDNYDASDAGGGGGGSVAGQYGGGAAGSNTEVKRGATVLASARVGGGGAGGWCNGYEPSNSGGAAGTNVSTGLTLTASGGSAAGTAAVNASCYYGSSRQPSAGGKGDQITGQLTVTPGESLTIIKGAGGGRGTSYGTGGSAGTAGAVTISWP